MVYWYIYNVDDSWGLFNDFLIWFTPLFYSKRIFLIYGKKSFTRGDHAHHKCRQFLVPIFGKMEVEYENKVKRLRKILND